jgi:PIN domain nuclease of toxin-antitoxin system
MRPGLLLDTHVLVRWLSEPKRLSKNQTRVIEAAIQRRQTTAFSPVSLIEIAVFASQGKLKLHIPLDEFFTSIEESPAFRIEPVTYDIAREAGALHVLRDPAIVATARVNRLQLVTSDQRIIESKLVAVID